MKFFEKVVLKDMQEFQNLRTEDKKRYVTLCGHYHFSQWLAERFVNNKITSGIAGLGALICILNILEMSIFKNSTLFIVSLPILIIVLLWMFNYIRILKLEEKEICKWLERTAEKIQNLLFRDFKVFSIRKRCFVRKIDKKFYKHIHTDACRGECYRCSFKLAWILNNPKIKIIWISATCIDSENKYGHSVIEINGRILDTNLRKSYKKTEYLKLQKAEIFKEYELDEYRKVKSPFDLQWDEFGKWCKERNVKRSNQD